MGLRRFITRNFPMEALGQLLKTTLSVNLPQVQPVLAAGPYAMSAQHPRYHHVSVGVLPKQESGFEEAKVKPPVKPRSLSVILPAYNEEAVIEETVTQAARSLADWTDDFEVVVVNDGSKDRTREIVERLARMEPRIRLINHQVNKGYGAALVTGFQSVSKELVFFMDSDGQFDIADLEKFFPLIEYYDAVLGYRNPRVDPWLRKFNAWCWKQLVRLVLGVRVRDLDCAFKLYRADFFQALTLETRGAMINAEIMYKFKREGYCYTEVGVRHLPREEGEATGAKPTVIFKALGEMLIYAWKWKKEERRSYR